MALCRGLLGLVALGHGAAWLLVSANAHAEPPAPPTHETEEELEITVRGIRSPVPSTEDVNSGHLFSRSVMAQRAGTTNTSAYRALDLVPSVDVEGTDELGIVLDPSSLRVRGQQGETFTRLSSTVERVPLSISVAKGSMGSSLDLANVATLSFYRGPVPADRGFGFGTTAGALDLRILRPSERPQIHLFYGGGFATGLSGAVPYESAFLRADEGTFLGGTRSFVSGSYNRAMKWRGHGDTSRINGTVGLSSALGRSLRLEIFGIVNRFSQHEYRPLTYAQSQEPSLYRSFDYTDDGSYLDYRNNRQQFTELATIFEFWVRPTARTTLLIQPYATLTEGWRKTGTAPNPKVNGVNFMDIVQRQAGLLSELRTALWESVDGVLGLWALAFDSVPPQRSQKFYTVSPSGELVFSRWNMLARVGLRKVFTPYLTLKGQLGRLDFDVGAKVAVVTMPSVTGYDSTGIGDVDPDTALSGARAETPGLSAEATTRSAVLPHVGARYAITELVSARVVYGRNFAYPFQGPLYSAFSSNMESFGNHGLTLDYLWSGLTLETSDNVDVGLTFRHEFLNIQPTLYYARFYDKQVLAYDPAVGAPYYRNAASAQGMGCELEVALSPSPWFSSYLAGSYNRTVFAEDLRTKSSALLRTSGKQFADAPQWMGKLGLTGKWREWSLSPFLRFVGTRYGDLMNTERVAAHWVVDALMSYSLGRVGWVRDLVATLRGENLLDRRYIGIIKNQQDVSEALSTTYYPGAPLTLSLSLNAQFGGPR